MTSSLRRGGQRSEWDPNWTRRRRNPVFPDKIVQKARASGAVDLCLSGICSPSLKAVLVSATGALEVPPAPLAPLALDPPPAVAPVPRTPAADCVSAFRLFRAHATGLKSDAPARPRFSAAGLAVQPACARWFPPPALAQSSSGTRRIRQAALGPLGPLRNPRRPGPRRDRLDRS